MESKKTFYNTLNKSQNLNNVFNYFASYRENVTNIIVHEIQEMKTKSLNMVIFGAGNLMDIDYNRLISLDTSIDFMITDIDRESMEGGLEFLNLNESRIRINAFNYLGRYVDLNMNLLVNQLNLPMITQEESLNKVESFFENLLKEFIKLSYIKYIEDKADLIIVMPIYTQLLYIEMNSKLQGTKGYPYIQGILLQKMIYVIDEFNQKLVRCLKEEGKLIVFSDIIEEETNQDKYNLTSGEIQKKIETYEKTYGVGLGSFGLMNISEYGQIVSEHYMNWDFNETRKFLVKGLTLKNSDNQ